MTAITRTAFDERLDQLITELDEEAHKRQMNGIKILQQARDQLWMIVDSRYMTPEATLDMVRQQTLSAFDNAPPHVKGSRA